MTAAENVESSEPIASPGAVLRRAARQLELETARRADALLGAFFRLQAPAWPRRGAAAVARVRRDIEKGLGTFEREGWSDDASELHADPGAPPAPTVVRRGLPGLAGLGYEEVRFESAYRPPRGVPGADRWRSYRANRTVTGWMLRSGGFERPWVVCVHGYGMGQAATDLAVFQAARLRSAHGANVLSLVLPMHGPRSQRGAGPGELITTGVTNMWHCHSQALSDVRRALAWLRSRGAERIAVHGISLGGNVAAMLGGVDADVASIVVGVPATDFTHSYREAAADEAGTAVPTRDDALWDDLRRFLRVASPFALPVLLPRERLAIYAGEVDGVVPASSVEALWSHWNEPEIAWYPGGHIGFVLNARARALVAERMRAFAS